MLNIRRERRREHPMDTSEGVTTGVAQLPKRNPKGSNDLRSHPVAMLLLLKKRGGKSRSCAEHTSGQGHFRSKGSTRADIVQLPVAHAQNILPDM